MRPHLAVGGGVVVLGGGSHSTVRIMGGGAAGEYERGHRAGDEAGRIAERLASHDKHFAMINGNIADLVNKVGDLVLAVHALNATVLADRTMAASDRASDSATVATTAAALRNAEIARRERGEQSWTPWQRLIALLGGLATLVGLVVGLVALVRATG